MEEKQKKTTHEVEVQEQPKYWNKIKEITSPTSEIITSHLAKHDTCQEDQ